MKNKFTLILFLCLITSCNDYLSLKPDKQDVIPMNGRDLWALLDDITTMNLNYAAGIGEMASDNYFMPEKIWSAITDPSTSSIYIWERYPMEATLWRSDYKRIGVTNVVLDYINKLEISPNDKKYLEGTAKFFRAYAHLDVIQLFSKEYDPVNASTVPGIPIRTTANINISSKRESQMESYRMILKDLKEAVDLLPEKIPIFPTRPYKLSALALLARCYLSINDYQNAKEISEKILIERHEMMDYNKLNFAKPYPFNRYNTEVIFYTEMVGPGLMEAWARVDSNLYKSYADTDLRKKAFFTKAKDSFLLFTGDYASKTSAAKFNGLTTPEMILIFAECAARTGELKVAVKWLNELIKMRYSSDDEQLSDSQGQRAVVERILEERRKELVFRGLRWSDLRRQEGDIHLERIIGNKTFSMDRKSLKDFAFLIPEEVIANSQIEQN